MHKHIELYKLYSGLLEYPTSTLKEQAEQCTRLLADVYPPAGGVLSGFQTWVTKEPVGQVEEIYTSAFDLQGICCLYVGHHLFGDNYQRSWFMAQLKQGYRDKNFTCGNELPDHVVVVLRFLALGWEDEFSQVLLEEGLVPAMGKMVQAFDTDNHHPYGQVLRSLLLVLQNELVAREDSLVDSTMGG